MIPVRHRVQDDGERALGFPPPQRSDPEEHHVALADRRVDKGRFAQAEKLFADMSLAEDFEEFLTLPAYRLLD